jgi:hypothetical protein
LKDISLEKRGGNRRFELDIDGDRLCDTFSFKRGMRRGEDQARRSSSNQRKTALQKDTGPKLSVYLDDWKNKIEGE